jgi:hypothetical protein
MLANDVDQCLRELVAQYEAAAFAEVEVGQFPDGASVEREREFFEFVEFACRIGAAHDRPDRRARDDCGFEARAHERSKDADMGPTACAAAAECYADPHAT